MSTSSERDQLDLQIERGERLSEVIVYLRSVARNIGMADTAMALDLALAGTEADLERMFQAAPAQTSPVLFTESSPRRKAANSQVGHRAMASRLGS